MQDQGPAPLPPFWTQDCVNGLRHLVTKAGQRIMEHRRDSTENAEIKADGSPVTAADLDSQRIVIEGLKNLTPGIPIIAEEQSPAEKTVTNGTFWLVDPLDGTRDYVSGGTDFSISIGLLIEGQPTVGLIHVPAQGEMYYGDANGVLHAKACCQTFLNPQPQKTSGMARIVAGRTDSINNILPQWQEQGLVSTWRLCSSAYKYGLLAEGQADLYPRRGRTYEWDTAAGDALLRALGGGIVTLDGKPLAYGKPGWINGSMVAYGPTCSAKCVQGMLTLLNDQALAGT